MNANALPLLNRGDRRPPIPSPAAWLGGTGLIPFAALAAGAAAGGPELRANLLEWLIRYGAVIVTFIGALHWGVLMRSPGAPPHDQWRHLGWSVVPALGAWLALALPPAAALAALIALFAVQLVMDRRLAMAQDLVPWFLRLRTRLTLVAVACLGLALPAALRAPVA